VGASARDIRALREPRAQVIVGAPRGVRRLECLRFDSHEFNSFSKSLIGPLKDYGGPPSVIGAFN